MDQLLVTDIEKTLNWRGNKYLAFCRFLNFSLNSASFLVPSSFLHLTLHLFLYLLILQPAFAPLSATNTMKINHTNTKAKKILLSIFFPWKQWSWSDGVRSPRQQNFSTPRRRLATKTQSTHLGLDEISDDNPYCSEYLTSSQSSTQVTQLVASLLAASRTLDDEMTVNRSDKCQKRSSGWRSGRRRVELKKCVSYNNKLYLHN